jgi:hydrogenase-4 component B
MTAGSALYRTGERDLNKIGGLARIMPLTAFAAVVASLSIAGLPPFNGFASKWMIFQASIFGGLEFPVFIILGVVALFISVVTLAAFVKYVATAFLGKPSAGVTSAEQRDVPWPMVVPQVFAALICIGIGLLPALALRIVIPAAQAATPAGLSLPSAEGLVGSSWFGVAVYPAAARGLAAGVWNPLLLLAALVVCALISYAIYRAGAAPVREVATWYCGEEHADELVRYRARGFYQPFKRAFQNAYPQVGVPRLVMPGWLRKVFQLDQWLYQPFTRFGARVAERFSRTHSGIPQTYMLWQVVGVIIVIALLFWLRK